MRDHGFADAHRGRLRLHHRRRRLGRLRAGEPALRRPGQARVAAGGRRQRQLDLVSHPGRLSVRHRQSALRLAVQDRARSRAQRPQPELSARQGDRRLLVDQCHDLHARPGCRLRSLAPARTDRLGLRRRAAVFPQARESFSRRQRSSTRSAANGGSSRRACTGTSSTRSALAAEQAGIKRIPDFNTGDNEGSCAFHVNQKRGRRWSAAQRLSQAGAEARRTCGWRPAVSSRPSSSPASARPACAGGRTAR